MPAGWQTERDTSSDDTEFKPVPFTALPATGSTSASTFMNSILLPLHLRPRYKLALAAQSAAGALRASRPCASPAGAANSANSCARSPSSHRRPQGRRIPRVGHRAMVPAAAAPDHSVSAVPFSVEVRRRRTLQQGGPSTATGAQRAARPLDFLRRRHPPPHTPAADSPFLHDAGCPDARDSLHNQRG
eukprot:COSAG06_NODE_1653_length_8795_cov_6.419273_3_plen_188_part_00